MAKEAVFTMKLEPQLRDEVMAEAECGSPARPSQCGCAS